MLAILGISALSVSSLQAQAASEHFVSWAATPVFPAATARPPASAPLPRLLLGAALGELASAGVILGWAAACPEPDDGCGWYALSAGAIVSAFAVPAGVRIAGSKRDYGLLFLGSAFGAASGYALAELLHGAGAGNEELLVTIPLLQIATTALLGR